MTIDLNLTQSAVSRQIKALEDQIGVKLFIRSNKKIYLTDAGKTYLYSISESLVKIANATVNLTTNPRGGSLNIAILPTFGTRWLAPRLNDFVTKNSGITLNISTQIQQFDFNKENIDIAIHFGDNNWEGAICEFLMEEVVIPVCSPQLLEKRQFYVPNDLLNENLLYLSTRPNSWKEWFARNGIKFEYGLHITFDQFATIAQAAVSGIGVALLPDFLISKDIERGDLVMAINIPTSSRYSYYIVYPEIKQNYPPLVAFRNWIMHEAKG